MQLGLLFEQGKWVLLANGTKAAAARLNLKEPAVNADLFRSKRSTKNGFIGR